MLIISVSSLQKDNEHVQLWQMSVQNLEKHKVILQEEIKSNCKECHHEFSSKKGLLSHMKEWDSHANIAAMKQHEMKILKTPEGSA